MLELEFGDTLLGRGAPPPGLCSGILLGVVIHPGSLNDALHVPQSESVIIGELFLVPNQELLLAVADELTAQNYHPLILGRSIFLLALLFRSFWLIFQ